ncbi:hypothetical protein BDZ85DRAFT_200705 [Elsinoe ampelina]|uniref:FAD/NAD(P)-binding domain-containing protein n=1 Tax=Elsinoe ampelina TaxID=302913 RepID=A0A6A6G862_9PEZI|nr:hypothetical protein BDZ85DRAFT_200705 [Elsinoe ampelina]
MHQEGGAGGALGPENDRAQSRAPTSWTDDPIPKADTHGYSILEQPMGTKKHLRVVLMVAGASTLNFLKQADDQLTNVDITVYEKNHDVGGTWLENRYPGAACDIPSVNYQFAWKTRLWSHYYSYAPEIWQYLKDIEQENSFNDRYIKLKHQIERAEWDDEAGVWRFQVKNLVSGKVFDDHAHFFVNAGGVLNNWKWPDIVGLHDFNGKLMHSAAYDKGYDLVGKKVAVIGAGSSGVQIVAAIQPKVKHLYHWVRSPIWITAGFAQTWAGRDGANFKSDSEEQLDYLRNNPVKYLEYRKMIENELNQRFKFIIKGSPESEQAKTFSRDQMERKLNKDPRLCSAIIPNDFNPGCRRPTPAPGYLEALTAPNTTVSTADISRITSTGFIDDENNAHDVDVIICATGFDTSWLPRFPFIAHGHDLRHVWSGKDNVTSYLSVAIPSFPNHFSFCGPYGPLGHGSFLPLIERWTQYIFKALQKCQVEHIRSISPKLDAARAFRQHADLFLRRTAWTSPCRSWFKQGRKDGQAAIYPGSRVHFFELLKDVRWEDFEIKYDHGNEFAFLGNGFDLRETDGRDITHYLGLMGEDKQPEYDQSLLARLAGWNLGQDSEIHGG